MLLPCPAAQAGSWTYTITADNSGTSFTDNGLPGHIPTFPSYKDAKGNPQVYPGYNAGIYTYAISRGGNGSSGTGCDITTTIDVQVTFTWIPDPNLPSDPPPDNVWVQESATALWSANAGDSQHPGLFSGSAANGLGNTEYDPPSMQSAYSGTGYSGPPPDQSYQVPTSIAQHFQSYPASSGTVTVLKRTVTASAITSYANYSQWYYGAKASVNYSASIHATPYNLRRQNFSRDTTSVYQDPGSLQFHYVWSSTTGNYADLYSETIHENVACSTKTDIPPFYWQPLALTDVSVTADAPGGIVDTNSFGNYLNEPVSQAFLRPYKADSFLLTQSFLFNDPDIMKATVEEAIPGTIGPFQINDAVVTDPGSPSGYSFVVTKDGVPSLPIHLP